MSTMPHAADVYTTQLSTLLEGFPLYDPTPGSQPAVEIADVGYVHYGAWARLFNASKGVNDPSNDLGVPEGYRPLNVGKILERACIPAKVPIVSKYMEKYELEVSTWGVPGIPMQAGGGFRFKCSKEQGAVLIPGDDADRRDAYRNDAFAQYFVEHCDNWLRFATEIEKRKIMLDDIVFVSGYDRTSSWSIATFSEASTEAKVSFDLGQPGIAQGGISFSWSNDHCSSVTIRSGHSKHFSATQSPNNTQDDADGDVCMSDIHTNSARLLPLRDQCIFLRGYKICDRKTWDTRRLFKLLRKKKPEYDGFDHLPRHKREDDPEDPDSDPSRRSTFQSPGQSTSREPSSHGSSDSSKGDGGYTTGGSSGSNAGGRPEEHDDPHLSDMLWSQATESTPMCIILYYILEKSTAELALVHHDDFSFLIQCIGSSTDFERRLHELSPKIFTNGKVGMLSTTYSSLLNTAPIQRADSLSLSTSHNATIAVDPAHNVVSDGSDNLSSAEWNYPKLGVKHSSWTAPYIPKNHWLPALTHSLPHAPTYTRPLQIPRLRPIPLPAVRTPSLGSLMSPPASTVVGLNELLKPSNGQGIFYDLTLPPSTIIFHNGTYSPNMSSIFAATPSMTFFRIIPPTTPPWPIMVVNPCGVTVIDVLDAIYHSLHSPVSRSVWDGLDLPHIAKQPPLPWRSRSDEVWDMLSLTPKLEGSRKVDSLQCKTIFSGLEKGPGDPESWILRTSERVAGGCP